MSKTLDILAIQDKESVKNTYYRAPRNSPHIQRISDSIIEVKTIDESAQIGKLEETILYIIASFKYSPFWLIQQWFTQFTNTNGFEEVSKWINIGLVWAETSSMGVFIRPTRFLLDMFKVEDTKFIEIPFGLLNHTCAEQQIVFDINMGNPQSELWLIIKDEETLPVYHPLGLKIENDRGTIAIREADFRIGFKRYKAEEVLKREEEIQYEINAGMKYTKEFSDFSRFPIVRIKPDTGELVTQTPDIIIPIPREKGKARSYAIEIELTPKSADKYIGILENYKDNIKFGKLFYLCGSLRIARYVKEAYKSIKGLGDCDLYLLPFIAPAQNLTNFSFEDETAQKELLKETARSTTNGKNTK